MSTIDESVSSYNCVAVLEDGQTISQSSLDALYTYVSDKTIAAINESTYKTELADDVKTAVLGDSDYKTSIVDTITAYINTEAYYDTILTPIVKEQLESDKFNEFLTDYVKNLNEEFADRFTVVENRISGIEENINTLSANNDTKHSELATSISNVSKSVSEVNTALDSYKTSNASVIDTINKSISALNTLAQKITFNKLIQSVDTSGFTSLTIATKFIDIKVHIDGVYLPQSSDTYVITYSGNNSILNFKSELPVGTQLEIDYVTEKTL